MSRSSQPTEASIRPQIYQQPAAATCLFTTTNYNKIQYIAHRNKTNTAHRKLKKERQNHCVIMLIFDLRMLYIFVYNFHF